MTQQADDKKRDMGMAVLTTVMTAAIIGFFTAFMSIRDGTFRRDERIGTLEKDMAALKSDHKDIPSQLTGLRKDLENVQATLVEIKAELAAKRR